MGNLVAAPPESAAETGSDALAHAVELLSAHREPSTALRHSDSWQLVQHRWITNHIVEERKAEGTLTVVSAVNQYALVEKLGQGSFAQVMLAESEGEKYAVKIIPRTAMSRNHVRRRKIGQKRKKIATSAAKVHAAVEILRQLLHPNLVNFIELLDDSAGDYLYLILEFCAAGQSGYWDGASRQYLQPDGGFMATAELRQCCAQVARGLTYLHGHNICHRDLKPENVLRSAEDGAMLFKIVDFGEATLFEDAALLEDDEDGDRVGWVLESKGTFQFFAPEMISSGRDGFNCFTSDVWKYAVTMYGLAFGSLPFDSLNHFELFEIIENEQPRDKPADADPLLCALIESILVKDPTERATLEQILSHRFVDYEK